MPDNDLLDKMQGMARLLGDRKEFVKKGDIVLLFNALRKAISAIKTELFALLDTKFSSSVATLEKTEIRAKKIVIEARALRDEGLAEHKEGIERHIKKIAAELFERMDGLVTPEYAEGMISEAVEKLGKEFTSENIRNHLELLFGEDRLDRDAVRGIDELEKFLLEEIEKVRKEKGGVGGGSGLRGVDIWVDGTSKGQTTYLNLIAGNGITLAYNRVGERVDITIDGNGGGGGLSVLTATGAVDDENTTFTFASEPQLVVVNGNSYRDGHGVTITGTTAELDSPVGSGGDIYGLG